MNCWFMLIYLLSLWKENKVKCVEVAVKQHGLDLFRKENRYRPWVVFLLLCFNPTVPGLHFGLSELPVFHAPVPKDCKRGETKSFQKFIRIVIEGNANGCLNFCCYRQAVVIVTEPTLILYWCNEVASPDTYSRIAEIGRDPVLRRIIWQRFIAVVIPNKAGVCPLSTSL